MLSGHLEQDCTKHACTCQYQWYDIRFKTAHHHSPSIQNTFATSAVHRFPDMIRQIADHKHYVQADLKIRHHKHNQW